MWLICYYIQRHIDLIIDSIQSLVSYLTTNDNINHFNKIGDISICLYLDLSQNISETEVNKLKSLQDIFDDISVLMKKRNTRWTFIIDVNHILISFVRMMDDYCHKTKYISSIQLDLNTDYRTIRKITFL